VTDQQAKLSGVWAAVITPVDAGFQPNGGAAIPYYHELLRTGCDGLNVLGTTGEAMSFSAAQRLQFMERLVHGGLPLDRMMVGTGAASLEDSMRLTRAVFEHRFAAALIMPPFFFRDASDDGIVRYFDLLFTRSAAPQKRVFLYNFPAMSGITFRLSLVDRLVAEFPGVIAGLKDSSNDAALQTALRERYPDFAIFPSSERNVYAAVAEGAAGCISGSVALWPQLAHEALTTGDEAATRRLNDARAALSGVPLIAAVRYLTSKAPFEFAQGDNSLAFERAVPPLVALEGEQKTIADRAIEAATATRTR
jgi:4-hydroxy-tetrahydrodipicolinate synthase